MLKFRLVVCCVLSMLAIPSLVLSADENVIWKASLNQYFKYAPQDSDEFGANEHPITLNERDIVLALKGLTFTQKKFLSDPYTRPVFSSLQTNQLARYLVLGLQAATPEQDIIFVMQGGTQKLGLLTRKNFIAGRAFYQDGKLNILIGDYDRPRNDAFESVYDPSGEAAVPYTFNYGLRSKARTQFKGKIDKIDGFAYQQLGDKRHQNWLLIDVAVLAKAAVAKSKPAEPAGGGTAASAGYLAEETAKLAQQRREMRMEMARMRKEVKALGTNSVAGHSAEARMVVLQGLLDKGLITAAEYDAKRAAILEDI